MSYKTYALLVPMAIGIFISCQKEHSRKDPNPPSNERKAIVTFNYPSTYYADVEIIVSESAGKILADTIGPTNKDIVCELSTEDTLLDVTYVLGSPGTEFNVYTYKAVDPTLWKLGYPLSGGDLTAPGAPNRTTITYTNVPANSYYPPQPNYNSYWFSSWIGGYSGFHPVSGSTINVDYDLYPGQSTYLLLPKSGLYKFTTPIGGDTVDLTTMDTAVRHNFNMPVYTDSTMASLYGFTDGNDYNKAYILFTGNAKSDLADLLYPHDPRFKKFFTEVIARDIQHLRLYDYWEISDTIYSTPEFFKPEDWQIVSRSPENFTISFPHDKPSYYEATYVTPDGTYATPKIRWIIMANPDSSTLHPLSMITNIKGIKMKNESLNMLALNSWDFYKMNDFDYSGYIKFSTTRYPFGGIFKANGVFGLFGDLSRMGNKRIHDATQPVIKPYGRTLVPR